MKLGLEVLSSVDKKQTTVLDRQHVGLAFLQSLYAFEKTIYGLENLNTINKLALEEEIDPQVQKLLGLDDVSIESLSNKLEDGFQHTIKKLTTMIFQLKAFVAVEEKASHVFPQQLAMIKDSLVKKKTRSITDTHMIGLFTTNGKYPQFGFWGFDIETKEDRKGLSFSMYSTSKPWENADDFVLVDTELSYAEIQDVSDCYMNFHNKLLAHAKQAIATLENFLAVVKKFHKNDSTNTIIQSSNNVINMANELHLDMVYFGLNNARTAFDSMVATFK